jgi:hypothetical protein
VNDTQGRAATDTLDAQRRFARRAALGLLLLASAIYAGFIYLSVHRGRG